jgi:anaerobic selenocysteine-containing dehydrogenase
LAAGQFVRVWNDRGSVVLRCRANDELRQGVVVISEGSWVKDFAAGDPYSLTHELVSATSENYGFYDTLVEIEAAALSRDPPRRSWHRTHIRLFHAQSDSRSSAQAANTAP